MCTAHTHTISLNGLTQKLSQQYFSVIIIYTKLPVVIYYQIYPSKRTDEQKKSNNIITNGFSLELRFISYSSYNSLKK